MQSMTGQKYGRGRAGYGKGEEQAIEEVRRKSKQLERPRPPNTKMTKRQLSWT